MFLAVVLVFLNCHNLFTSQIANFNVLSFPGSLSPNWVTAILDDAGDKLAIIVKPSIDSVAGSSVDKALTSGVSVIIIAAVVNCLFRRNLACAGFRLVCASTGSHNLTVNNDIAVSVNRTLLHICTVVNHIVGDTAMIIQTLHLRASISNFQVALAVRAASNDVKVATFRRF